MTDELEDPTYVDPNNPPMPYKGQPAPTPALHDHDADTRKALRADVMRWAEDRAIIQRHARDIKGALETEITRMRREVRERVSPMEIEAQQLLARCEAAVDLMQTLDPNEARALAADFRKAWKVEKMKPTNLEEEED